MNLITLFVILWGFVSLLEFSWKGFKKFFSVILFPGKLVKLIIRFKMLERKIESISFWTALDTSAIYFKVAFASGLDVIKFVLMPTPLLILLSAIFIVLSTEIPEMSFLFMWLSISFFISAFPESSDFEFIFLILAKKLSEIFGYVLWSIAVFASFYYFLGFDIAVIATALYFLITLIFLLLIHEDEIIGNESEVIKNVGRSKIVVAKD